MKKYLLIIFSLATGMVHAQLVPASTNDSSKQKKITLLLPAVEKIVKEYAAKNNFPAIAYGIVANGKLVYSNGSGFTNISNKTPATAASLFRIASMTKSLTAMAILKLRDEGKLQLDDAAAKYMPELKNIALLTTDAPAITIRNLMTHTAGFPEDNPWGDRQLDATDEAFITMLKKGISFSRVPGIAYEYSNMGFAMLGKIITIVSGKPYQQYITENILQPLGMQHTVWEYTNVPLALLAHGYRWENNQWKEEALLHDGAYGAMGGLITSIEDFGKYLSFQLSAWPPRDDKDTGPVKRSSLREMQQPWAYNNLAAQFTYPDGRDCAMVSSYGYGLRVSRDCAGRVYVGHTGGLPGFGSQWWIMPDYGIGVMAFGNLTYASMGNLNWAVMDTLIKGAQLAPPALPASAILSQRKDELMKLLPHWNNASATNIFAVNFFPDHSIEDRKKKFEDFFSKLGKIKRVTDVIPENQLRGIFYIEGENTTLEIYFTLTPEQPALIQYLDVSEVKNN
ncbi:MAG: serine hydrolase domain-containing protein [Agriterribacter sp.]